MTVVAVVLIGAQSAFAGPVTSVTACLKEEPKVPLGTAVYSSWADDDKARLEIAVAGATPGTYCIFINEELLSPDIKFVVDDAGVGELRLDTQWGDDIPVITSGMKISLKSCPGAETVLCGMFK